MSSATPTREASARPAPSAKSPRRNAPDLVFIDPTGNCFLQNDSNRVMEQHRGERPFAPEVVATWRDMLTARAAAMRAAGIEYLFLLGPDKQSVFWPSLGNGVPDHRNVLAILNDGLEGVTWVDPTERLIAATAAHAIYPQTDSHWDMRGAFIAYQALIERSPRHRGSMLREGTDFEYIVKETAGDLGNKLPVPRLAPGIRIKRLRFRAREIYRSGVLTNGGIAVFQKPGGTPGRVGMLFGDSYSHNVSFYLAEHFNLFIHVRGTHFDAELVRRIAPDMVISEATERFMSLPPLLLDDQPTELVVIRKLQTGEIRERDLQMRRMPLKTIEKWPPLPPAVADALIRHDALVDVRLAPAASPAQDRFRGDIFADACPADVLVAGFLAHIGGVPLAPGWATALAALPEHVRLRYAAALRGR